MARTPARLPNGARISDFVTLGVLTTTVPAELIDGVLQETGRQSQRCRLLPAPLVVYLSLSRLSHWLPRGQAHPEIMQGTADFHHDITDALLPQADSVFDDAASLDTAVDMLDPQAAGVERLVRSLLRRRQVRARGFLCGHEDRHLGQREAQEAEILQQPAPGW